MIDRSPIYKIWAFVVLLAAFGGSSFAAEGTKPLELSAAIGQAILFAGMTDDERAALKMAATLRQGQEGERIIEQGKRLDSMFIVLEGSAEVRIDGRALATLPEQSLVGEIEFLDMLPANADVTLLKASYLIKLDNATLRTLMNEHPRLGYVLMSEIAKIEARRLRAMDQK